MQKIISINNSNVSIKEYNGNRVITFKDIDTVHGRADGTARRNFNSNKERFLEGTDYYKIQPNEIRTVGIKSPNGAIVITESGYLMLAKSFTDDLAWNVQRQLVNCYFRCRQQQPQQLAMTETQQYEFVMKYYRGEPVVTLKDIEAKTGLAYPMLRYNLKKLKRNKDYFYLEGKELADFKKDNNGFGRSTCLNHIIVINKSGFIKLAKILQQPKNSIEFKPLPIEYKDNMTDNQNTMDISVIKIFDTMESKIKTITNMITVMLNTDSEERKTQYLNVIKELGFDLIESCSEIQAQKIKMMFIQKYGEEPTSKQMALTKILLKALNGKTNTVQDKILADIESAI